MKKPILQIPADVGAHCRQAASVLTQANARLARLLEIWADDDPDPENGDFWHVQIAHPEVARLRENLRRVTDTLNFLADHGDHGLEIERQPDTTKETRA
ncbi:hypothetical protein [Pontitalea aquivivens]|uniref:hypothetical protein n=1 Tax=Pontitalea aquivivens TaxID=3388663 RepID=UPI003970E102